MLRYQAAMPGFAPNNRFPRSTPPGWTRPDRTRGSICTGVDITPGCAPRLSWSAAAPDAWRPHAHEDLRCQLTGPRAQLAPGRRRGPDPRPPRHPDRRAPARQAKAGLYAARGHGRLRRRDQRREDLRHRPEAAGEDVLPPFGLP